MEREMGMYIIVRWGVAVEREMGHQYHFWLL